MKTHLESGARLLLTVTLASLQVGDVHAVPRRPGHGRRGPLLFVYEVSNVLFDDTGAEVRHRRLGDRREHRSHSPPVGGRPRCRHQAPPEVQVRENRKRPSYDVSALRARVRAAGRRETLHGESAVDPVAARCRGGRRGRRRRRRFLRLRGRRGGRRGGEAILGAVLLMLMMVSVQADGEVLLQLPVPGLFSFRDDGVVVGSSWTWKRSVVDLGRRKRPLGLLRQARTVAVGL